MPLYQMTVKASKTFYVEGNSQKEALNHKASVHEFSIHGELEFEVSEMQARECSLQEIEYIHAREPELIIP